MVDPVSLLLLRGRLLPWVLPQLQGRPHGRGDLIYHGHLGRLSLGWTICWNDGRKLETYLTLNCLNFVTGGKVGGKVQMHLEERWSGGGLTGSRTFGGCETVFVGGGLTGPRTFGGGLTGSRTFGGCETVFVGDFFKEKQITWKHIAVLCAVL